MAKTYNIPIFDISVDEDGLGLFGLSFVDNPATQVQLHAFKADERQVFFSSKERHEVVAPVLIPNQLIIREAMGIPYYMRASKDTIQKIYEKYMLSGNWNNFTYMHENIDDDIDSRVKEGIYLQRLWIIGDEKTDKANTEYGFSLPAGTLMMKAKVLNRKIWSEIREGKLRGISLEALFDKVSTNKALQITYSKMKTNLELFSKFIAFLNEVSVEADDIASEANKDETNSGVVELKYYIDDEHYLTVDGDGIVRDEKMNPVQEGEYKLSDGNVFVVGPRSIFVETKAADGNTEEDKVEPPVAETFEEDKKEEQEDENVKKNDDDSEGKDAATPAEDGSEKPQDGGNEDDGAGDEKDDKKNGEALEDVPADEPVDEEPSVNALPYEIDGIEYLLPEAVINYIEGLKTSKIEVEEKLTKMREVTPSAKPIGTVIKDGSVDVSDISGKIASLSMFKGFRNKK